jgi:phosphate ABC transporter permease protein PstC
MGSSLVAILTTVGIVASLLFESLQFFQLYPASEFYFSTVWNPQFRGGSDFGFLPLLWGTLYVSFVALLVAVPIGLMIAIYLAEYSGPALRSFAKPAIEVLAGIPTIVYGLFALITVGPFLRDWIAQPLGLGTSSASVMTAGLVMGIMLIPFISSLSDDIINAVPQAMRDGSYGLGATQSETIKQVILPAALPGIVGAFLLAASRAIGETMIVVMGAGAAARLDLNPFEAMTTVTVKIVSQLTGDTEFASPETLVAFALGLTLFRLHARLECSGALHCAQIPGAIRMTEITADHSAGAAATGRSLLNVGERTRKRNAAEKRFRMMGLAAVAVGIIALVGLMASILSNGLSSFSQTYIALDVYLDPAKLDKNGNRAPEDLQKITTFTIQPLIKTAVQDMLDERGFAAEGVNPNEAAALISGEAPADLRRFVLANPTRLAKRSPLISSRPAVSMVTSRAG